MTPKNLVSWIPESSCFRTLFWSQQVNGSARLRKCARRCFYANFPLISNKSRTSRSLLVKLEILVLCFNKLTGVHMYSRLNREIFPQIVWTKLSQKPKTFIQIFIAFLKSTWNFQHFGEKGELHSLNISEVIDTGECRFLNSQNLLLQNTLLK